MQRSTIDKLIATTGVIVATLLLLGSCGLLYLHSFIHGQVNEQLSSQHITFPEQSSPAFHALSKENQDAIAPYAGQALVTGAQAKVFADNYIAAHLEKTGHGKTYAELSTESRANPSDTALANTVETVFRGETLRGMLLNAYAFDTMAVVARYAAIVTALGGVILTILALLGFAHAKTVTTTKRSTPRKKR